MSKSPAPPEGGYGWVIVLAAGLTQCFSGPIMAMFGLLFGSKFDQFESTPTERNSVFAIFLVTWCITSLLAGPIVQIRSSRFVAFCATVLNVCGLLIISLANCTEMMFLGYGLVMGAGMGLNNLNNILIMTSYFKKRISLAYGIYATGLTVAQLVLPQLVTLLLRHLSDQQTILIYAALTSVGFIGSLLMKPVDEFLVWEVNSEHDSTQEEELFCTGNKISSEITSDAKSGEEKTEKNHKCGGFLNIFTMINWNLLRDPNFIAIAIGNSFVFNSVLSYISQYVAIASEKGLTLDECANLISAASATEIVAKLLIGFLGDLPFLRTVFRYPKKSIYTIAAIGMSFSMLAMTFSYNFTTVLISVLLGSFFLSAVQIYTGLVYAEVFPSDLASALGISNLSRAALAFAVGPVIGALREVSASFDLPLYFLMSAILLCMAVWITMDLSGCSKKGNKQESRI